jgi:hypothetical protein
VPVLRLSKDNKLPELGSKQQFLATYTIANEQSSKMLLGLNKSIITMFQKTTVRFIYLMELKTLKVMIIFRWFSSTNIL